MTLKSFFIILLGLQLILFVANSCICRQRVTKCTQADSTIVRIDSVSYYVIRLYVGSSENKQDFFFLTLDKDFYEYGKLKVAESRENIYIKDDDCKGQILELYKAYYTILCHNPVLNLENLCIPTTAHGVFYQEYP